MQSFLWNQDQSSANLKALIENLDSPIRDVLSDKTALQSFKASNVNLHNYINNHVEELFDIVFLSGDSLSKTAFAMFSVFPPSNQNNNIFDGTFKKDLLAKRSQSILKSEDDVQISRFSVIATNCCLFKSEEALKKCPFLPTFLSFLHLRTVESVFETFFSEDESRRTIQECLFNSGLLTVILNNIKNSNPKPTANQTACIVGTFRVIKLLIVNDQFKEELKKPEIVKALARDFPRDQVQILNQQWETLNFIFANEEPLILQSLLPSLLVNIKVLDGKKYFQYQVSSLNILGSLATASKAARDSIQNGEFANIILDILTKFPNHSFACSAVYEVINKNLNNHDFASYSLNPLIKLLTSSITSNYSYALRCIAWQIVAKLKNTDKLDASLGAKLKTFPVKAVEKALDYYKLSEESYGGELPELPPPSELTNSTLSLPQIIQFLQQYIGSSQ